MAHKISKYNFSLLGAAKKKRIVHLKLATIKDKS